VCRFSVDPCRYVRCSSAASGGCTIIGRLRSCIGLYVSFSPWLHGIYNHATIAGMTAQWRETEGATIVSFRPRSR